MDERLLHLARLNQLRVMYDLDEELPPSRKPKTWINSKEVVRDDYPQSILRPPHNTCSIDDHLRPLIAKYLHIFGTRKTRSQIEARLPLETPTWSGVRVKDGGDKYWCAGVNHGRRKGVREACFVRYEVAVGRDNRREVYYGRLEKILELDLTIDGDEFWNSFTTKHFLLALITPCKTDNRDGAEEIISFEVVPGRDTQVIVDLQTIASKIGRIATRGRWGIIDRSSGAARAAFFEEVEDDSESDKDE
ncbi:hypothetical protein BC629DRAFT_1468868 [Irpex lacteus]|nr:hypothetical protein BC629DRAFT_1468868 [Irpex lacteus]